jgi:hypothetical protein
LFQLELTNLGQSAADYKDSGTAFAPLTVLDGQKQPLPCAEIPRQIMVRSGTVAPGATVVLADKIDLKEHYSITRPGKYFVQFRGKTLQIGQPIPSRTPGPFGERENESMAGPGFLAATNQFPSEPIEIEVLAADQK